MAFKRARVAKLLGQESGLIRSLDAVSKSDVRHWCELIGDPDPDYAGKIKSGEKTVPPTMLMVWAMDPLWPPRQGAREPHEKILRMLDEAGYTGTVGVALQQEFLKPVRLGERLSFKVKLVDVSRSEERTRMGSGHLVNLLYTFVNRDGETVGRNMYTILKFRKLEVPC